MSESKLTEANEGQRIEDMRYELGRDAAQRGDQLHDNASEEFTNGYKSYRGFGSNVTPAKFGKGATTGVTSWFCVCGHENRSNRIAKRGGEVVCWLCGVQREYSEDRDRASEKS